MNAMTNCPLCRRSWRVAPSGRLPLWAVKQLAFHYVEAELGITELELRSPRRQVRLVQARTLVTWIAKTFGPRELSYPQIGRWLNKDHTSVMHEWTEVAPRLLERDADFALLCGRFGEWAAKHREIIQ